MDLTIVGVSFTSVESFTFSFISSHCAIADPSEECVASTELTDSVAANTHSNPCSCAPANVVPLLMGSSNLHYLSFFHFLMNILNNLDILVFIKCPNMSGNNFGICMLGFHAMTNGQNCSRDRFILKHQLQTYSVLYVQIPKQSEGDI